MIDKQIHNYKITREIGSGGMATVYEAVHVKLENKVAIKILNPILAANEGIRQRFEQEAKIMASLNHTGITKVIDYDEKENNLAIVMEYLEGVTLDEHINQKGALSEQESGKLFQNILEAFAYAHNMGIVHRDVKPSNLFITTEGKIKIMDFGIAKIVEDGANVLTQTGTQMGTPVYMSPEQVNDSKNIDHLTDVYSLGVMLYFMLSGKPPYDATKDSSFQIFTKIVNEPVPELPGKPSIDSIIKKATEKDKLNRYKNCNDFIQAFQSITDTSDKTITQPNKFVEETKVVEKPTRNVTEAQNASTNNPKPTSMQAYNNSVNQSTNYNNGSVSQTTKPVYNELFNIKNLSEQEIEEFKGNMFHSKFSAGAGVLFHYLTLGIFTMINCGVKHSKLPLVSNTDFGSGKAIGLLFVPFFNFYWIFIFWRRLAMRLNFQFKLRNENQRVSVGLATTVCILAFVPYLGIIVNFLILKPILYSQIQSASNALVVKNMQ